MLFVTINITYLMKHAAGEKFFFKMCLNFSQRKYFRRGERNHRVKLFMGRAVSSQCLKITQNVSLGISG